MRQIGYGFLFLDQLVQSSASHQAQSPRRLRDFYMKEALSFIEQHYSEDISIEDISSFCGLNRSYFSKVFRDTMGESPQGFLLHYRMARAAQLLTESRLPISTISTMVSYPNQLHFFPCVQKNIWHQPTGLSCKASCTIKIGLILRYTPFVFPTYKNAPFVRPNTVGQMGCCSFRDAPCFFILPLIF